MDNFSKLTIEEIGTEFLNDLNQNSIPEENVITEEEFEIEKLELNMDSLNLNEETNFSDYKFEVKNKSCSTCGLDMFTIAKDNSDLFSNFIDSKSTYNQFIFNFLNKIKNLD